MKNIKISKKRKERMKRLGYLNSPETRLKMRLAKLGTKNPEQSKRLMGHKHSEETKKKISKSMMGKCLKEKSPLWMGGKSYEPYSLDWTATLRRSIRERDKYTCQLCKEPQTDTTYDVHHIDYNKSNCNPENLITLCRKCHAKTHKNREYWTNYFKLLIDSLRW